MILAACPHCMQCIGVLYLHLFFACCIHTRARALTRKHTHTPLACLLYRRCCQHLAGTRAHLWGGQTQDSMVVTVSDLCSFDARGCRAEAGGRDAHMQEFLRNVCVMRICFCTHVHIHFCMRPCEDHGHAREQRRRTQHRQCRVVMRQRDAQIPPTYMVGKRKRMRPIHLQA